MDRGTSVRYVDVGERKEEGYRGAVEEILETRHDGAGVCCCFALGGCITSGGAKERGFCN